MLQRLHPNYNAARAPNVASVAYLGQQDRHQRREQGLHTGDLDRADDVRYWCKKHELR